MVYEIMALLPVKMMLKFLFGMCLWTCLCYLILRFFTPENFEVLIMGIIQQSNKPLKMNFPIKPKPHISSSSLSVQNVETKLSIENLLKASPRLDRSTLSKEKDILRTLQNSNLPLEFWFKYFPDNKKRKCSQIPNIYDLQFNNIFWQHFNIKDILFYLYKAYYDNRKGISYRPVIRILAMINRLKPPPVICHLWFENITETFMSEAIYVNMWWKSWGNYKDGILQPYLITCPVPKSVNKIIPKAVSISNQKCKTPSNIIKVNFNPFEGNKKDFGVCVKGMDFLHNDISVRLVEWLELLQILGAKKVFFYNLEIHPNISKVLKYYEAKGFADITPLTLPGNQPNTPGLRHLYMKQKYIHKRQNELIPYNDCLYRNLYNFEYVVLLDIDEIIVPVKYTNWSSLMMHVRDPKRTHSSYYVRNVYFFDDVPSSVDLLKESTLQRIPQFMHMLQHVYRAQNFTKPRHYVKSFYLVDRVISLQNHFPFNCLGKCSSMPIDTKLAKMQHYRKDCVVDLVKSCKKDYKDHLVKDITIWRYKDELVNNSMKAITDLKFI